MITLDEIKRFVYLLLLLVGFSLIEKPISEFFISSIPWLSPFWLGMLFIGIVAMFWKLE